MGLTHKFGISIFPIKLVCFVLFSSLIIPFSAKSQITFKNNFSGNLTLTFQFGTTINRLGIVANSYFTHNHFQINTNIRWHYNFSSYGPPLRGDELVWKIGAAGFWGAETLEESPFLSAISHQSKRKYSVGYSFNKYYDRIGTNQVTGTIAIQLNQLQIITENDAFAPPAADKFRTASGLILYRLEDRMIALNTVLWTGDPFTNMIDTKVEDPNYPGRFGYRDMKDATHGGYSHGIVSLQYYHLTHNNQVVRFNMGADWEYFRHAFQNWIIHDMYYFPAKWKKIKTPHIPMLDDEGLPYIFKEGQRLKPPSFFAEFGMNTSWFY